MSDATGIVRRALQDAVGEEAEAVLGRYRDEVLAAAEPDRDELILAVASAHQPVVHDPWITDTDRRAADNVLALLARTRREGR